MNLYFIGDKDLKIENAIRRTGYMVAANTRMEAKIIFAFKFPARLIDLTCMECEKAIKEDTPRIISEGRIAAWKVGATVVVKSCETKTDETRDKIGRFTL